LIPTPGKKSGEESKANLQIINKEGLLLIDSREVAEMVEKNHAHLLRDIKGYIEILTQSNFGFSDFFIENNYRDSTRRTLPCYLLTRKGCDIVANKMTGKKGVLFTAAYVTKFEEMERIIREQRDPVMDMVTKDPVIMIRYDQLQMKEQLNSVEERMMAIETRLGKQPELLGVTNLTTPQTQPVPTTDEHRWYTCKEIAMLAKPIKTTYHMVGKLATKNNLRTEQYFKIAEFNIRGQMIIRKVVFNEAAKDMLLTIIKEAKKNKRKARKRRR